MKGRVNRFAAMVATAFLVGWLHGPVSAEQRQVPEDIAEIKLSFAPIVKRVAPAVVNVYASRVVQQQSPFLDDPFFRRFFGGRSFGGPTQRVQRSLGSGVIIDSTGIIVTNHHVIAKASEIKVALADRREFDCDVILTDERTDLAVLRIRDFEGTLPFLEFADSDELEVGDLVLAIGDPFGVGQTVTSGIVSALARTKVGISDYQFFIQTDAAINPGNSGGALIDMNGGLVGINTAIFSRTGDSSGIGFAIPSNMVQVVARSAESGAHVRMPWIGVRLQAVTPDIAEGLGLSRPRGALVVDVRKGSPGARAGLTTGDLVLSIDDVAIDDPSAFNYRLATKGIGTEARIGVLRDGKQYAATLPLEGAPETVPRDEIEIGGMSPLAGARVVNLSPAVAEELAHDGNTEGVIVALVADGSAAAEAGLVPGDVVLEVNGRPIDTTRTLEDACSARLRTWEIAIERNGRTIRTRFRG
ncbi:Do/DeqQ family serine protease [Bauldia litoralis]|uniref:Do/DeqQ family serine protease n=2 Tax=Bauldia litoralis TaxID=665467 RepID=A0A1G6B8J8_9HYPH|nr:Do/DeqQ family serine protease [Bauldia litoralis]